jgi:putative transposase
MPDYIRTHIPGASYFFTVALLERHRHLLTENISALRAAFRSVRQTRPFRIDAIVVLPDHLHCIWTLPTGDADFSTRWRLIKGRFAQAIPPEEPCSPRRVRKGERGIWQRRFWEHVIRDEEDFAAHADYIHYNPVRHGWVERVADWPYSSFHRYVRAGIYPRHWAAAEPGMALEWE